MVAEVLHGCSLGRRTLNGSRQFALDLQRLRANEVAKPLPSDANNNSEVAPFRTHATNGGQKDAEITHLLSEFGPLNVQCGNPTTDFQATLTLDTSSTPPVVALSEVWKGHFSSGPVTQIDWIRDIRLNEFGRPTYIIALLSVYFLWDVDDKGTGQMTFDAPGPSTSPPEADLALNARGRVWGFTCRPMTVFYTCSAGMPGCG